MFNDTVLKSHCKNQRTHFGHTLYIYTVCVILSPHSISSHFSCFIWETTLASDFLKQCY